MKVVAQIGYFFCREWSLIKGIWNHRGLLSCVERSQRQGQDQVCSEPDSSPFVVVSLAIWCGWRFYHGWLDSSPPGITSLFIKQKTCPCAPWSGLAHQSPGRKGLKCLSGPFSVYVVGPGHCQPGGQGWGWERRGQQLSEQLRCSPWIVTWKRTGVQTDEWSVSKTLSPGFLPGVNGWGGQLRRLAVSSSGSQTVRSMHHFLFRAPPVLSFFLDSQPWKFLLEDPEIWRMETKARLVGETLLCSPYTDDSRVTSCELAIFVSAAT